MTRLACSRRTLLRTGALALAGAALATPVGRVAFAGAAGAPPLVLVILRGALDGLAALAPAGDRHYAGLRGALALPPERLLPVAEGFGLHPALAGLHAAWGRGELACLHAASTPYRERSHFDAQDVLESGAAAVYGRDDGWLNRALGLLDARQPGASGLAVGGAVPLALRGAAPSSAWAPSQAPAAEDDTLARLADLYADDAALGGALARATATAALVAGEGEAGMRAMGMDAGRGGARAAAAEAWRVLGEASARLLAAPGGPSAAVIGLEGWDTHAHQGGLEGPLAQRLGALDGLLEALRAGLGEAWSRTAVIVATEFGRTAAVNGTGGTDHGTGGLALLLGGAVRGGRLLGDWPGLAPGALHEGRDLAPANDLRGLFAGVLAGHWGLDGADLRRRVFADGPPLAPMAGLLR